MNKKNAEEKVKGWRISIIDSEIRSGKYPNCKQLVEMIGGVSTRTIERDIDFMKDYYKAPIDYDYNKRGFYYTKPDFFVGSVMLSKEELDTIALYDKYTRIYTNKKDDYSVKFRKIIEKLLLALPEDKTNNLNFNPISESKPDPLFPGFLGYQYNPSRKLKNDFITQIWKAVEKNEIIKIEYTVSEDGKKEKIEIEPLAVFLAGIDELNDERPAHILAWKKGNRDKIEIYYINQIINVISTGKHFKLPENFDYSNLPNYFFIEEAIITPSAYKLYQFEFSFPKEYALDAIEKDYALKQQIKKHKDGTASVSFKSTQIHEVFRWVLSEGHKVKVLNPPELVNMIKREAQKVVQYYV